jgi:hypothetical protein
MAKFFVVYRVPVETMQEWKKNTSPEEMKAQGEKLGKDMMAWTEKNKTALVDRGQPLGKTKRLTAEGVQDISNDLNYYCIVEADSHDAAVNMFKDNPHLQIATSFLDIMEIPHMGM